MPTTDSDCVRPRQEVGYSGTVGRLCRECDGTLKLRAGVGGSFDGIQAGDQMTTACAVEKVLCIFPTECAPLPLWFRSNEHRRVIRFVCLCCGQAAHTEIQSCCSLLDCKWRNGRLFGNLASDQLWDTDSMPHPATTWLLAAGRQEVKLKTACWIERRNRWLVVGKKAT